VVLSGEAQLSAPSAVGHITVRVAKPGDTFPLASLLGADALITTAKAMTPMKVLSFPTADLIKLCVDDPEIGVVVFREAAKVFADRYSDTLQHLARAVEREADPGETKSPPAD
jgi:CRP-like cAMP-binding protein